MIDEMKQRRRLAEYARVILIRHYDVFGWKVQATQRDYIATKGFANFRDTCLRQLKITVREFDRWPERDIRDKGAVRSCEEQECE